MEAPPPGTLTLGAAGPSGWAVRAEVDTSAPFESVREAVDRFGGSGAWKPQHSPFSGSEEYCFDDVDIRQVDEQTAELEKVLIVKERETLDVLKELEKTKNIVNELRLRLEKETTELTTMEKSSDSVKVFPIIDNEGHFPIKSSGEITEKSTDTERYPALIMNAKTGDLDRSQASVELLGIEIERERASLQKTCEKISLNIARVASLEEELRRTKLKLQLIDGAENHSDISKEINRLTSSTEQFKKMAEVAKSEVHNLTAEIEHNKASIKIAEIRWLVAKKMEAAAKAGETVALAEINALLNGDTRSLNSCDPDVVSLPIEEYAQLALRAQDADERSRNEIEAAMRKVDEANKSKEEVLTRVEEVEAEFKTSKDALEKALDKLEKANAEKLAVEEALRRWRSEHGEKRRTVHNSVSFKNSYPGHHRRDSRMLDLNDQSFTADEPRSVSETLSIGQILGRKIKSPEKCHVGRKQKIDEKPKISLGEILNRRRGLFSQRSEDVSARKQFSVKRKKLGFIGFSLLLAKQNKQRKKRQQQQAG